MTTQTTLKTVAFERPARVTVAPGETATARLRFTVAPGYHIQAANTPSQFMIPARLQVRAREGLRAGRPEYPEADMFHLPGMPEDLPVYDGTFEITVPVEAADGVRPGRYVLSGALKYQACDERSCLFPESAPVRLEVEVGD
jgi:thioredoxin:protein disulfide reductase